MVEGEAGGVSGAFRRSVLDWTASGHPGYPLGLWISASQRQSQDGAPCVYAGWRQPGLWNPRLPGLVTHIKHRDLGRAGQVEPTARPHTPGPGARGGGVGVQGVQVLKARVMPWISPQIPEDSSREKLLMCAEEEQAWGRGVGWGWVAARPLRAPISFCVLSASLPPSFTTPPPSPPSLLPRLTQLVPAHLAWSQDPGPRPAPVGNLKPCAGGRCRPGPGVQGDRS